MKKWHVSVRVVLVVCLLLFTQSLFSAGRFEYQFHNFSDVEGFSSSFSPTGIVQDDKGYIWVGTFRGLYCYDGYRNAVFKNLPSSDGSFNNIVSSLETDDSGYLWIGRSFDRLVIMDLSTRRIIPIRYEASKGAVLPVFINFIKFVRLGEVWAATASGELFRIKYRQKGVGTDSLILFPEKIPLPGNGWISDLLVLKDRVLVSKSNVLYNVAISDLQTKHRYVANANINKMMVDSKGCLWLGTTSGVCVLRLLPNGGLVDQTPVVLHDAKFHYNVLGLVEDASGSVFFATEMNGLFSYRPMQNIHPESMELVNYNKENSSLPSNQLNRLFIDKSNILWIGMYLEGMAIADLSQKRFYSFKYFDYHSLYNEVKISRIFEDSKKRLWIGTDGDGLYCCDMKSGKRTHLPVEVFRGYFESRIVRIMEDRAGNVWFGTYSGLFYLPADVPFTGKSSFKKVRDEQLEASYIGAIAEDEYGDFWLSVSGRLHRLRMDMKNNTVRTRAVYQTGNAKNCLPGNSIHYLTVTNKNTIWVGFQGGGMCRITYHRGNNEIAVDRYAPSRRDGFYVCNKNVWWIVNLRDSIWTGSDGGLSLYTRNAQGEYVFRRNWDTGDGLPSNEIGGIQYDGKGNLWLDTGNGLSKFSADRKRFYNFSYPYGSQSNSLAHGHSCFPHDTLYFGTPRKLYYFDPDEVGVLGMPPRTQITSLLVFNEEVHPGEKVNGQVILTQTMPYTRTVCLSHKNNNFSLQFSAFNFALPRTNTYEYILEGYDKKWMKTFNHENSVAYSNLPSGDYLFKVRAINGDGVSDLVPAVLQIAISPAPWRTWWAYSLYGLTLFGLFLLILNYFRERIRFEHEILLERRKREQEHELSEMKINFFTNMSHELRTPLTLITLPLSEIRKMHVNQPQLNEQLELISINAERLIKLTNHLLEFRKIEQETVPLRIVKDDAVQVVQKIFHAFEPLAVQKNITLVFVCSSDTLPGFLDPEVVDTIVSNLIFNAVKYTPEYGKVEVGLEEVHREQGDYFHISVSDTGKGIPTDELEVIFDKFYQHEKGLGYGIGLWVVKRFVLLHHGTICVDSRPAIGTTFTVELPAFESAYLSEIFVKEYVESEAFVVPYEEGDMPVSVLRPVKKEKMLLVVEDNNDLRNYLCRRLSNQYTVLAASDGKEGYKKSIEYLPDLIVSDIRMPGMDGMAFLAAVKSDMRTNHIPFIFLTAKDSVQNQVVGLSSGAEDYIVKPFDIEVLRGKIHNLLQLLAVNREKQRKQFLFEPLPKTKLSSEDEFLQKTVRIIRENLTDTHFNAEKLSSKMAMSRMHLYRKLKEKNTTPAELIESVRSEYVVDAKPEGLTMEDVFIQKATSAVYANLNVPAFETAQFSEAMGMSYIQLHRKLKGALGMSITEFIRSIRMKHAAELLETGKYRISEVMFEVGFDNPSHFARTFKMQFGQSPREYLGQHTDKGSDKTAYLEDEAE